MLRIARLDAELYHFLSDPEPMIERLRSSKERIDIFTFLQGLPETKPKFKLLAGVGQPGGCTDLNFRELVDKANRRQDKEYGEAGRKEGRRQFVRSRSMRGSCVESGESTTNARYDKGGDFRTTEKTLRRCTRTKLPILTSSTFIGAFYGEELIGFIKMVADEAGVQAGLMNILSKLQHRDKAPTNALIAQAVKSCAPSEESAYLVYANFAYGNKQHDSLREFKERNGFRARRRPTLLRSVDALWPDGAAHGFSSSSG